MFRLPDLSSLKHVLDAALRVDGAACGIVFGFSAPERPLTIAAHHGVPDSFFEHEKQIRPGDGSATGQAVSNRYRVVIRDFATDPVASPHRDAAERAGILAITATPLIGAKHKMRGVLAVFYTEPHHPTPDSLELLDTCADIAVNLMEVAALHAETDAADREMGIPQRALSPAAAQAADAAQALLPMLGRAEKLDAGMLSITARHLALVADELAGNLKNHRGRKYVRANE